VIYNLSGAFRPSAVASTLRQFGGDHARLVVWASEMPMKEFMIPHTVPNNPTKGAMAPMVASTPVPRAIRRDIASLDPLQPQRDALLEAVIDHAVGQHCLARRGLNDLRDGIASILAVTRDIRKRKCPLRADRGGVWQR